MSRESVGIESDSSGEIYSEPCCDPMAHLPARLHQDWPSTGSDSLETFLERSAACCKLRSCSLYANRCSLNLSFSVANSWIFSFTFVFGFSGYLIYCLSKNDTGRCERMEDQQHFKDWEYFEDIPIIGPIFLSIRITIIHRGNNWNCEVHGKLPCLQVEAFPTFDHFLSTFKRWRYRCGSMLMMLMTMIQLFCFGRKWDRAVLREKEGNHQNQIQESKMMNFCENTTIATNPTNATTLRERHCSCRIE